MNINVNIRPKKALMKKIFILIFFLICCFFIKENVFATDLDGNTSTQSLPPFLENFYTYSDSYYTFTCDDETEWMCSLYDNLEQYFSEIHTLYKKVTYMYTYTNTITHRIYFHLDTPYTNFKYNSSFENTTFYLYNKDTTNLPYYEILIDDYYDTVKINYYYGSEDNSTISISPPGFTSFRRYINTNYNLYNTNGNLYHQSDVKNFTYIDLAPGTGISFKPLQTQPFTSYFSYNKENLYLTYYNFNTKEHKDWLLLDKPVSDTITYDFTLTSEYLSNFYITLYNRGTKTMNIGYISDDFELIKYSNLNGPGVDNSGNEYDNPLGDLEEDINSSIIYDSNESILNNIVRFFSNFGNYLLELGRNIINGIGNFLNDIKNAIVNLGNYIVEKITSLFIPDNDFYSGYFNATYKYVRDRLGFLAYPIDVVIDFVNRFYDLSDSQSAVFKIPKVDFMGHTLLEAQDFDLLSIVNASDPIKYLYNIYRVVCSAYIVIWLVQLAIKKEKEIFGGGLS